jgi:mono/diheme cytochrome c family protein
MFKRLQRLTVLVMFGCASSIPSSSLATDAAKVYAQHCASCHGPDGRARTPIGRKLGVKDLTQSRIPDAEIERQIREGRKGDDGKEKMPPFKARLSDDEVRSLVAVVKGLRK